jgi:hypothetical protein
VALKQDERSLPGSVVSPDSKLFTQSLNKYRQFVKRNSGWIAGKNSACQPRLGGIFARCLLDQLPEVAQVLLGGKAVAQTDSPDCATVQLFHQNISLVEFRSG